MASKSLFGKPRTLTSQEDQTSFDCWVESVIFHISLSEKSTRFLAGGDLSTWTTAADRGFVDDTTDVAAETRMNRAAKAALLNVVLGAVSTFAPVISPKFIKHQSTSLESIWCRLRGYYGFRRTGSRILDLMSFRLETNESREALYERMYSFYMKVLHQQKMSSSHLLC